jgi:four helix bundle protein
MADSFRDLVVWQEAMALATDVYRSTNGFPRSEIYGLTGQLRRAAVGVPSNIAEGKGRLSKKEFIQFLAKARGSLCEVDTQLEISKNLEFLDANDFERLSKQSSKVGRRLNALITSIQRSLRAESREPRAKS